MNHIDLTVYSSPEDIPGYDALPYCQRELLRAQWETQISHVDDAAGTDNEVGV